MEQGQRIPGGSSPRQANGTLRADSSPRQTDHRQSASDNRETERARHRAKAFQDWIQEGDEGEGEWESSARCW